MRSTGYVSGPVEGSALLYKAAVFKELATEKFNLADWLDASASQEARVRVDGGCLALLEHKASRRKIVCVCTHLFWDPYFPDVKLLQAEALCRYVNAFLLKSELPPQTTPVMIAGDFNSLWRKYASDAFDKLPAGVPHVTSGVYELLSTGSVSASHQDHPQQRGRAQGRTSPVSTGGLELKSAFADLHGHEPALTTRTDSFEGTLDYIWLSCKHFRVAATLPLPFPDSALAADIKLSPCPNEEHPSDHLPVTCDVELLGET